MFLLDTTRSPSCCKLGDGKAEVPVAVSVSGRDAASFHISALTRMALETGILRIERCYAGQRSG